MSIPIRCDACGHEYRVNPALAGKRVKCKQCSKPIRVPDSAASVQTAKRRRHSALRNVFAIAALLIVCGAGWAVYLMGRNMGIWGEPVRQRHAIATRTPTAAEQREHDRQTTQEQLKWIGQALQLYADEHHGYYPARLRDVFEVTNLAEQVLVSPFGGNARTDYTYLHFRSMGTGMPAQTVVAYDAAALQSDGATAALYANGKIAWLTAEQLNQQIQLSEQRRMGLVSVDDPSEHEKPRKRRDRLK